MRRTQETVGDLSLVLVNFRSFLARAILFDQQLKVVLGGGMSIIDMTPEYHACIFIASFDCSAPQGILQTFVKFVEDILFNTNIN